MKETTAEQRKIIVENVVEFLKPLLMDSQKALKLSGIKTISFDEFITTQARLEKAIDDYDKSDEGIQEKAGKSFNSSPKRRALLDERNTYRRNADNVSLTEQNIDELMGVVSSSIIENGFGKVASSSNANYFLRGAFIEMKREKTEIEKKWSNFVYSGEHILNPKIEGNGSFSLGYSGEIIHITNNDWKTAFKMKEDGTIEKNEQNFKGQYYFADDIIANKDGDKVVMCHRQKTDKVTLNDILNKKGLDCFVSSVYSLRELQDIERALNNLSNMKCDLTKPIDTATEWWTNAIRFPKFDNGDTSKVGEMTQMMALMNNLSKAQATDEQETIFKNELGKRIKAQLLVRGQCDLDVDYHPDHNLAESARAALLDDGLNSFPCKTHMTITPQEVKVSAGYRAEWQTLYTAPPTTETTANSKKDIVRKQ